MKQSIKRIKKIFSAVLVVFLLSGCAGTESVLTEGETSDAMVPDAPLVLYYSFSGEMEQMAKEICKITDGQCIRLNTAACYPEDDAIRMEHIQREQMEGVFPELDWNIEDMNQYDTVYIGTGLWNEDLPPAVKTFLSKKELAGKVIIPFGTVGEMDSGEAVNIEELVKQVADGAEVKKGFLQKSGETVNRTELLSWLTETEQIIPIKIQAGETELTGVLFHNKISEEFAGKLPLEVSLYQPADFAKAFNLEEVLTEPVSRTRMLELGGLAYWPEGPAVALFFRDNVERTVVPVYTLGKVLDDVQVFEEYEGSIRIIDSGID